MSNKRLRWRFRYRYSLLSLLALTSLSKPDLPYPGIESWTEITGATAQHDAVGAGEHVAESIFCGLSANAEAYQAFDEEVLAKLPASAPTPALV